MNKIFFTLIVITILNLSTTNVIANNDNVTGWHSTQESYYYQGNMAVDELPTGYNDLFAGSGECIQCHNSMVNSQGESISIMSDWRSTMMANAARDPFWRAKVSHEGIVNPEHKEVLENVCTRCHATVGNENAHHNAQALYSIADMVDDPLAMDGVQCTVCHQITEESLGNYSGTFLIGTEKTIWGPYTNPFGNPMINQTGYTPAHGDQITNSELCASCHTLITNSVDNNGNLTGNQFVEQAIYHEWLNSSFPDNNQSCQSCHVPRIEEPVVISTMPPWLDGRVPFGQHQFAGANIFMLNILKDNAEELGVTATGVQFDSTIARNYRMLQNQSLSSNIEVVNRTVDSVFMELDMTNMAGHKFPGGYPSRRVFVELIVSTTSETIFHSGEYDSNGNLLFEDSTYEPHYNIINAEDQVQIYELVMGDINYDVTTVLERANFPLKDNRFPPVGFTTSFYTYDTVPIIGYAFTDVDFNKINGTEGSGADILHFHVPTLGNTELLNITANIYYQTVNDKWLAEMFSHSSDEIDLFKEFYNAADKTPVLVKHVETTSNYTTIEDIKDVELIAYPNPTSDRVYINSDEKIMSIVVFNIQGQRTKYYDYLGIESQQVTVEIPSKKGVYFVVIQTINSKQTRKIVVK
ncbi:MAG: T9SS type A sorting domain-containing protein [Bacteroidota bacterium]